MGRLFDPRTFLFALALAVAGVVVGGAVPLLGGVGRFVGVFAAALLLGLVRSGRHYVEAGAASAVAAALGFLVPGLDALLVAASGGFLPGFSAVAGVGVGSAVLVSIAGHYFGRDLRAGLTRDLS